MGYLGKEYDHVAVVQRDHQAWFVKNKVAFFMFPHIQNHADSEIPVISVRVRGYVYVENKTRKWISRTVRVVWEDCGKDFNIVVNVGKIIM